MINSKPDDFFILCNVRPIAGLSFQSTNILKKNDRLIRLFVLYIYGKIRNKSTVNGEWDCQFQNSDRHLLCFTERKSQASLEQVMRVSNNDIFKYIF